jgi:tyrosyl-tRNA synthetase
MKYLEERASAIQPLESFHELVKSGKKLRVKLGVDPTAPDVTLGWYAIIRALRKFQEEGHTAVLILGEFTAQVGDPSGKSETRTLLEESDVSENSKGVLPVIKNILHEDNLEIVSNKDWLSKLTTSELVNLASSTTLAQMLERDDFSKRFENNNPISLMEFFYPMFQGYDSVAIKADIEIGGHDQLWNLMLGREIQKFYDLDPQVAMTFPLLIGTDGKKKMSQSLNNYISVSDKPEDIFGKIMSIPDEVMWDYFLMLTDVPLNEIDEMKKNIDSGENPFEYKKQLGQLIVQDIYSKDEASNALEVFQNITINKNIPEDIPIYDLNFTGEVHLPKILTEQSITSSNSEARRLITAGSFKIDGEKYTDLDVDFIEISGKTLQLGKRNFFIFN